MSPASRPGPAARVDRRHLLGLAAAGLLPAGCARDGDAGHPPILVPPDASGPSATASRPVMPDWSSDAGGPVPARPGKAMLGSYLSLSGRSLRESVRLRRRQLGREQRIMHYFYAWEDGLPDDLPYVADDCVPMLSWRGTRYDEINSGSADGRLRRAARNLARFGEPIFLRWAWEMNGDWYVWGGARNGGDIDGFVAAWRRLHGIFDAEGADNVAWVWSPNWNSHPDEPDNDYTRYYPGDSYVDWVGVSGYNHHRESPEKLFGRICATYGDRFPVMLSEVGAIDKGGRTKPEWIAALSRWIGQHPVVAAVVWFDTDTHRNAKEKFRIDSSPEALAAYRAMARSSRLAG